MKTPHHTGPFRDNTERLLILTEELNAKRKMLRTQIEAAPKTKPCEIHNLPCDLLIEESINSSTNTTKLRLKYNLCPSCKTERKRATDNATWRSRGIPTLYHDEDFSTFAPPTDNAISVAELCNAYAKNPKGFLALIGNPGTGKTHLACSILKHQKSGYYTDDSTLLTQYRRRYDDKTAEDIKRKCQQSPLLVLDDIGVAAFGNDHQSLLFEILKHRYGEKYPTILIANTEEELKHSLGERLIDCLREAKFAAIHFDWESARRNQNKRYIS